MSTICTRQKRKKIFDRPFTIIRIVFPNASSILKYVDERCKASLQKGHRFDGKIRTVTVPEILALRCYCWEEMFVISWPLSCVYRVKHSTELNTASYNERTTLVKGNYHHHHHHHHHHLDLCYRDLYYTLHWQLRIIKLTSSEAKGRGSLLKPGTLASLTESHIFTSSEWWKIILQYVTTLPRSLLILYLTLWQ
jgi:hypothetical protein